MSECPRPPGAAAPDGAASAELRRALELVLGPAAAPKRYATTRRRTLTRRGLVWLGQTCNLRCHFCYFRDRITDPRHPEHDFMSLDKAKEICRILVDEYGNNAVDVQGGEPTLFPGIYELVEYCRRIGLHPTLITNAQRLASRDVALRFRDAGIRDFLVSVQGLGAVYDRIVGRSGAHVRQMLALRNLRELGIPFRFNTVVSRPALPQLPDVARLAVESGALVVNYLAFNPYDDQRGARCVEQVPRYSEIRGPLGRAIDQLEAHGVEANARYLPLCTLRPEHLHCGYNFQQLSYDHHENDFDSWRWSGARAQRTRRDPLGRRRPLARRYRGWGAVSRGVALAAGLAPGGLRARRDGNPALHRLYRVDAQRRAHHDLGYAHVPACADCDLRGICDGFASDYARFFGTREARPVRAARRVRDPLAFVRRQRKLVEEEDLSWALPPGAPGGG